MVAARRGVARVAVELLVNEAFTEKCSEILLPFFDDPDQAVRAETVKVFGRDGVLRLPGMANLVSGFIKSAAFATGATWLLLRFGEYPDSLIPHADSLLAICQMLSGPLAEQSRGFATDLGHAASYVPPLLLRLYEQAQDEAMLDVQDKCLDAWDLLFEHRVGMIRDLAKALDR